MATRYVDAGAPWQGPSTASLEERIFVADVVVRARLATTTSGVLTFTSVRYLKGTGPARFTVAAETAGRDTQFDDQDAILFLVNPAQGISADFEFADTTIVVHNEGLMPALYEGDLPEGYMPDTRNPVWLPVATAQLGGVSGQSGGQLGSGDKVITGIDPQDNSSETVTGSELTTAISWIEGSPPQGDGASGASGNSQPQFTDVHYKQCIIQALRSIRTDRNNEIRGRELREDWKHESALSADDEWNTPVYEVSLSAFKWSLGVPGPEYPATKLIGRDGALFVHTFIDDDGKSDTGYTFRIAPARPLAGGVYTFIRNVVTNSDVPCNWPPGGRNGTFTVTVAAAENAIHEAFFDPATTTAGVGYSTGPATTTGVLSPAAFSTGGATTTITGLKWHSGSVVLSLSPFASLGDHQLEFIDLDGSTAFALRAPDATADSASGTLTWTEADTPWSVGDLLMLRIGPAPDSVPAPQGVSVSLADDAFTISWSAVAVASAYRVQHRTGGVGEWTGLPAATSTSHTFSPQGGPACETTYEFRVQARGDGQTHFAGWGAPSMAVSHTTGLCNRAPAFGASTYSFFVADNAAAGAAVGTLSATDPDGDTLSYSITAGNGDGNFDIDSASGQISLATTLRQDAASSYRLTVRASDTSGSTATATARVTPAPAGCLAGVVVNPDLVADCLALLRMRDTLAGTGTLDWSTTTTITGWDGVTVSGAPQRVTALNLPDRSLTGSIPQALGGLAQLRLIRLDGNRLTGGIPAELGSLTDLQTLRLSNNRLSGAIPAELGNLTNLGNLRLGGNSLTGCVPPTLSDVANSDLDSLGLPVCLILPDPRDRVFPPNQAITAFALPEATGGTTPYTYTASGLPSGLAFDTATREVSGTSTTVGVSIVTYGVTDSASSSATASRTFAIRVVMPECANGTSVPSPDANPGLVMDCSALLASKHTLRGTATLNWSADRPITEWDGVTVGAKNRVTILRVTERYLSGRIPPELGGLTHLDILELNDNRLTGTIPPELGKLSNLRGLFISDNRLTGVIPPELGNLSNMKSMALSGNQLTGSIPSELSGMARLWYLSLAYNQLTGCVPPALRDVELNDLNELGLPYCP